MLYVFCMFCAAYLVLGVITAIITSVHAFAEFKLIALDVNPSKKDYLTTLAMICIVGLVSGALFPYVWYKCLQDRVGK